MMHGHEKSDPAVSLAVKPANGLAPRCGAVRGGVSRSGDVEVAAVTVGAVLVLDYMMVFPGRRAMRLVEQWAAGRDVDRATALEGTYS